MNNCYRFFYVIAVLVFFVSCKKVIELDLHEASPRPVIEGAITNKPGPYYIFISTSLNFNDSSYFSGVEDANVVLSDDVGDSEILSMTFPGIYQTTSITGVEGRTYTLQVTLNEKRYTSVCRMPYAVALDTLLDQKDPTTNSGYALIPVYRDPATVKNFYRFQGYEGTSLLQSLIRVRKDVATNGEVVKEPVGFENFFNPGDTATLEFMCIDESVYQYFFGLSQTLGTGLNAPASPGNPPSNISGGCLGYFSAHTVQSKTIVIQ